MRATCILGFIPNCTYIFFYQSTFSLGEIFEINKYRTKPIILDMRELQWNEVLIRNNSF